jgi:RNA polymerase sigma factor (sigma-70 family)
MKQEEINTLVENWQLRRCEKSAKVLFEHYEEDIEYYVYKYPHGEPEERFNNANLGFTIALSKYNKYAGASFRTYLAYWLKATVVRGLDANMYKNSTVDVYTLEADDDVEAEVEYSMYLRRIDEAIAEADPRTRLIVLDYVYENLKNADIGKKWDISAEAVRQIVNKFFDDVGIECLKNR